MVWMMRNTVYTRKRFVATAVTGPVVRYKAPNNQNAGIFSRSFRCARLTRSIVASSNFTLPLKSFASSGFENVLFPMRTKVVSVLTASSFNASTAAYSMYDCTTGSVRVNDAILFLYCTHDRRQSYRMWNWHKIGEWLVAIGQSAM